VAADGTTDDSRKRQNPCNSKGFGSVSHQLSPTDKIGATGFEPVGGLSGSGSACSDCGIQQESCAAGALRSGDTNWLDLSSVDVDLQEVIAAWTSLPTAIRRAITSLIE
jgi:hypothetical protein